MSMCGAWQTLPHHFSKEVRVHKKYFTIKKKNTLTVYTYSWCCYIYIIYSLVSVNNSQVNNPVQISTTHRV